MAEEGIKVLMMGARRAGKTSVLSGLYSLITSEILQGVLCVKDVTSNRNAVDMLSCKAEDMRRLLKEHYNKTILMDENATSTYLDYTFEVSIPENRGSLRLTFTDANGEFYATGAIEAENVKARIPGYDIIIVAIDTPFLMEAFNKDNSLCTKTVGEAYNQVRNVHTLLANIDDNEGNDAKLIFFVPIKCERWVHEERINEVTECIEMVYSTPLKALCAYQNVEVVILPVETVGSLEFDSHREAMVLSGASYTKERCAFYDSGHILLSNGTFYKPKFNDLVQPDGEALIEGVNIKRPNSWFYVTDTEYAPHNCDQLAYYILQFALSKSLYAKKAKKKKHGWFVKSLRYMAAFALGGVPGVTILMIYDYSIMRMGSIKLEKLQKAIDTIRQRGVWKITGEGIKVLNKGLLNEDFK